MKPDDQRHHGAARAAGRRRKSREQLLAERSARFEDASALRKPDRILIFMRLSFFLADWGGSATNLLEDHDKRQQLLERAALHFPARQHPRGVQRPARCVALATG